MTKVKTHFPKKEFSREVSSLLISIFFYVGEFGLSGGGCGDDDGDKSKFEYQGLLGVGGLV